MAKTSLVKFALKWMTLDFTDDKSINIDLCNGFAPSGSKPLFESMLTQFYVVIWRHQATRS